jgi:hypothetical protein
MRGKRTRRLQAVFQSAGSSAVGHRRLDRRGRSGWACLRRSTPRSVAARRSPFAAWSVGARPWGQGGTARKNREAQRSGCWCAHVSLARAGGRRPFPRAVGSRLSRRDLPRSAEGGRSLSRGPQPSRRRRERMGSPSVPPSERSGPEVRASTRLSPSPISPSPKRGFPCLDWPSPAYAPFPPDNGSSPSIERYPKPTGRSTRTVGRSALFTGDSWRLVSDHALRAHLRSVV